MSKYQLISDEIKKAIETEFKIHPFSHGITIENVESVLAQYFAMSQAFPYLQAGAQKNMIIQAIENNSDIEKEFELTSVVGNFLCWDETGGHAVVRRFGNSGLPEILNTSKFFHSNMLRDDIKNLLGKSVSPKYSNAVSKYLKELLIGLESFDHITRCAYMVSFENHAGIMIDALWDSLSNLFKVDKNELLYFKIHVGGEDPAEPYHIQMTERMVTEIVNLRDVDLFIDKFNEGYLLNFNFCKSIKNI